ncbi:Zn(II)2Cys6 transcription factor [Aaosphaeria arxii CBS 175.79]|uniref:Zn(II)2Cys6 transcription factor n=1 Tax=Aaosphaeria arxii CBS 175.79 TaxID=1450172 RepID=A0A6A5Y1T1_9PLEO|nr:Zn(II)2Cys6 transcription factor [Aaosphaeria arxii CBS 175.79]KAF2019448.1 Zn(II)2Cys6 transcription factor [Aaosphaeria arxii CBS 175.79]
MATSNETRRVTKRSSNACSRCRRQKIKCSGLQPCASCSKRNMTCVFDDRDNKVLVTQGYLSDLQEKVARWERTMSANPPPVENPAPEANTSGGANRETESTDEPNEDDARPRNDTNEDSSSRRNSTGGDAAELTNPLTSTPSKFLSSSSGRPFYLGTSSNWSFHGRVLSLVHEYVYSAPLSGADLLFDGLAYDLPYDAPIILPEGAAPIIPGIDYAIYLINAVKFHCAQLVHLFDEDEFMTNLHNFYSDPDTSTAKQSLWYIHFLLIMAFGKTFVQNKNSASRRSGPPGADFFARALQLLPDNNRLCRQEPAQVAEILCCEALYLQALDSRNAAHMTIGQAMRVAQGNGMHTDMPTQYLGEQYVQRCRKIWWTIYVLDRQMSSLMGLPLAIKDEDISCQLPIYPGSPHRTAALNMQIKLARILATIYTTIYGREGKLRRKFVVSMKAVLDDIASSAEELRHSFPLQPDERFGGISRMPAQLHLLYYQSIIIATRPLLFCCLKKRFEAPREADSLVGSNKIRHLLHLAVESALKILTMLGSLMDQGLLETFLPWDLDSLSVSTMVLIVTWFVDHSLVENQPSWVEQAFTFLETMISGGNRIAEFRRNELRKLEEMLSQSLAGGAFIPPRNAPMQQHTPASFQSDDPGPRSVVHLQDGLPVYASVSDESNVYGDDLTADQILAVAESMDIEGTDWLSFATMDSMPVMDMNQV